MKEHGYIYIILCGLYPSTWRKIGFTMNTPRERAKGLEAELKNSDTAAIPKNSKLCKVWHEYAIKIEGSSEYIQNVEQYIHAMLKTRNGCWIGGEWFLLSASEAQKAINDGYREYLQFNDVFSFGVKFKWFYRRLKGILLNEFKWVYAIGAALIWLISIIVLIGVIWSV